MQLLLSQIQVKTLNGPLQGLHCVIKSFRDGLAGLSWIIALLQNSVALQHFLKVIKAELHEQIGVY